jgi:DTW domain-containing protein YfiP
VPEVGTIDPARMSELPQPRLDCRRCGRPRIACYCAHVTSIPTRTRVVVLQHPRERHKAIGTARIAAACLPSAEILVGFEFEQDARARALLADPAAPAVLLYPSPEARDLKLDPPREPVTLVVIDGTWSQARSLLRKNPWLEDLPKVAFAPEKPSEYRIRREPREDYVSTLEAMVYALGCLEEGDPARFQALMAPFRAMVDVQVAFASRVGEPRWRRTRHRVPRATVSCLPPELLAARRVCLIGEANAWPHDRALGGPPHPHELVYCCAAVPGDEARGDEARFERLIAPRLPLSDSPVVHARLSAEELARGVPLDEARSDWNRFVRPEDVLCVWGHHSLSLLQRDDMTLPRRVIDVRRVAGEVLRARPGRAEALVERLGLPWRSLGRGRGGERLGMLVAITRWLVETARESTDAAVADDR